ncbi:hypothetical protein BXY51_006731 [Actinoplanes cyaneus]|nr:hypothetical protein [Actinoplanes cyaneus]
MTGGGGGWRAAWAPSGGDRWRGWLVSGREHHRAVSDGGGGDPVDAGPPPDQWCFFGETTIPPVVTRAAPKVGTLKTVLPVRASQMRTASRSVPSIAVTRNR